MSGEFHGMGMIRLNNVKLLLLTELLVLFVGMVSANESFGVSVCGDCLVEDFQDVDGDS